MASLHVLVFDHEGRPLQFDTWLDDLQLYLLSDSRDSVSLFDHTSGAALAPPTTADSATRSHWLTREAAARLAIRNHLLLDHFLSLDPTSFTVDLLEKHLLAAETSAVAVGAARATPRTPFFEGCSPSPLVPSYASAAAVDILSTEDVGAASASMKCRSSKGKGGRGGGGGSGGGGGGSSGGSGGSGGGGSGGSGGGSGGVGGSSGGRGGSGGSGSGGSGGGRTGVQRGGTGGGQRQRVSCPNVISTGDRAGQTCGKAHTQHRCFSSLDEAWRAEFGDEVESPHWAELLRSGVAIFDLDYDAILSAMYALSVSAEGDCYRCVPPDLCIEVAALGAGVSSLPGTAPAEALHTFTLDSGASRFLFRDSTTLTHLPAPVPVKLADPSLGPVVARSSTVLPWPSLYTLATEPPQVATTAQVSASSQVAASCLCRLVLHQTLMWHHRLGHPSLPRLRGMLSRLLVSGLPRSLPPLPPSPSPPCLPCVEGQQRAAPHSSSFPPTTAPLQTLHMDVWGSARDLRVLRLHSDRGGEFSSDLLRDFCRGEGIVQSFTLPASLQKNGIAERRIGLIIEVARTSMIHAAAPHFLRPFAVRYAAHQLNLWPRVSLPETSPTLRWTGEVGDASVFRVWGSRAFVRDTSVDKFSFRAIPCVFLGFVPNAPGWQFYHPKSRRVFPSQDVTFDELVTFTGHAPSGVSQVDPLPGPAPVEVAVGSGAARGVRLGLGGEEPRGAEPEGVEPGGAESEGAESGGAEPRVGDAGDVGAAGTGVTTGADGTGGAAAIGLGGAPTWGTGAAGTSGVGDKRAGDPTGAWSQELLELLCGSDPSPLRAPSPYTEHSGGLTERCEPASRPVSPVHTARHIPHLCPPLVPSTHAMALRSSSVPLHVPLPAPPQSSLPEVPDPESDRARAATPTVSRLLATVVTDPSFEYAAASPLVAELLDFDVACRLDYATALVAESESASPPSVGGECALGTDVLEDRQEDFECLAAAVPRSASMLLAPEVPPPRANIVDGMWIFRVKRQPGSPPAFKARYVARGFSQRQGFDFLHTFSPTPKMTTLRVLLHVAAQRDYELHSQDFSTAFLQGSLHEEIWLRCPPRFTGSFPASTQLSFRIPVYGLCQAPREWHDTPRTTLAALGFVPSTADPLTSSCEAEIYAGAMAAQELHWLTYLLTDLGEQPRLPPQCGQLRLAYVATRANTADIFTKALQPGDHQRFSTVLGLLALHFLTVFGLHRLALSLWELVERPPGVNIMKNRWVLTTKYHIDDTVERVKARLSVKGFTLVYGANYDEMYVLVSSNVTLRIFLSIVAVLDLNLMQLDMKNAFLQSKLDRQSPLLWYRALDGVLLGAAWKKSQVDTALYFKVGDDKVTCWVLVYVDDLLVASSNAAMLKELKELLKAAFKLREIFLVQKYLGLEIVRDRSVRKQWVHQQGYADKLCRRFLDGEQNGRTPKTPVSVDAYDTLTFDDEEAQVRQEEEYRQIFGSLQFAAMTTRPDIAFACSKLGSSLAVRSDQHWREVDCCLAYLTNTRDTALEFGGGSESLKLVGYVDADDVGDKQNRTSTGGYVFVFGGAAVSWLSQRIKCATMSSTELEYMAATEAGKEGRRLCFLLAEFRQLDAGTPTVLRVDNNLAITVAEGMGLKGNLKHMERRQAWLQHMVKRGKFSLRYILTAKQPADFLTKSLHYPAFNWCSVAIGQVRLADVGDGDNDVQQ
ncbi:unnamed protein product [Closterium sp. NIES-53]